MQRAQHARPTTSSEMQRIGIERLGVDDGVTVPCTHDAVAAAIHRSTSNVRGDGPPL
jgi:hypothetical protein